MSGHPSSLDICGRSRRLSSRYNRYEGGERRSRSRSADKSHRMSQYNNDDRRRPSTVDQRASGPPFPGRQDINRDPPRGPKALQPSDSLPNAPRGGYNDNFTRGRGRARGGGRGWVDDSRDRGREREMDFRSERGPYRGDDRSRERDREWDRRDDFRQRRLSPNRPRSPSRPFHDRDQPLSVNPERARGSRDGGPPSAGSTTSDPPFGGPGPYSQRGGFNPRGGRGRGRGDWNDRGRRNYYDDHRFPPRSRSQEGRWGNRDRDREDRFSSDFRDRDDRDFRDRDMGRPLRLDRPFPSHDNSPGNLKDPISPPPLTPSNSLPPFNPRANRASDGLRSSLPHPPRNLPERPGSAGHGSISDISIHGGSPTIPVGPKRGHGGNSWNPNLPSKKVLDSPKPTLPPRPPFPSAYPSSSHDDRRPCSSDAKTGGLPLEFGPSSVNAIPVPNHENKVTGGDSGISPTSSAPRLRPLNTALHVTPTASTAAAPTPTTAEEPSRIIKAPVVRFQLPPSEPPSPTPIFEAEAGSIEDEEEDEDPANIGSLLHNELEQAEGSMRTLMNQSYPFEVIKLFTYLSHEALTEIVTYEPDLPYLKSRLIDRIPERPISPITSTEHVVQPKSEDVVPDSKLVKSEISSAPMDPISTVKPDNEVPVVSESASDDKPKSRPLSVGSGPATKKQRLDTNISQTDNNTNASVTNYGDSIPVPDSADVDMITEIETIELTALAVSEPTVEPPTPTTLPSRNVPIPPVLLSRSSLGADSKLTPPAEAAEAAGDVSTLTEDIDVDEPATDFSYLTLETKLGMNTPPMESLPNVDVVSWWEDADVINVLDSVPDQEAYVASQVRKQTLDTAERETEAKATFRDKLIAYFDFVHSDDPAAVKSRGKFSVDGGLDENECSSSRKPEGRSRRFASERDLQRIIAASIKEDEERKERAEQLKKDQCRNDEKEAVVPDMVWGVEKRANLKFIDDSGFIPVRDTVRVWQCLPAITNFTDQEQEEFVKAYLERPKQWGMIADAIEKRDFRACIQYYYLRKRHLDLKAQLKKQSRRKKRNPKKTKAAPPPEENEGEESHDTNENGERRRPRRAAAPTFGEQSKQAAEEKARAESVAAAERPRKRRGGKQTAEEKEREREVKAASKAAKAGTTTPQPQSGPDGERSDNLSVPSTPVPETKSSKSKGRSRASSYVTDRPSVPPTPSGSDSKTPHPGHTQILLPSIPPSSAPTPHIPSTPTTYISTSTIPPPNISGKAMAPSPKPSTNGASGSGAAGAAGATSAPASSSHNGDRRAASTTSSYWSVNELEAFPGLLRTFGTDWQAIAHYMTSKSATMVKNMYGRDKGKPGKEDWEAFALKADEMKRSGEKMPDPPSISVPARRGGKGANSTAASAAPSPIPSAAPSMAPTPKLSQMDAPHVEPSPMNSPVRDPSAFGTGRHTPAPIVSTGHGGHIAPSVAGSPAISVAATPGHQRHHSHSTVADVESAKPTPTMAHIAAVGTMSPHRQSRVPPPVPPGVTAGPSATTDMQVCERDAVMGMVQSATQGSMPVTPIMGGVFSGQQQQPMQHVGSRGIATHTPDSRPLSHANPAHVPLPAETDMRADGRGDIASRFVETGSVAGSRISMKVEPDSMPGPGGRYDPYRSAHTAGHAGSGLVPCPGSLLEMPQASGGPSQQVLGGGPGQSQAQQSVQSQQQGPPQTQTAHSVRGQVGHHKSHSGLVPHGAIHAPPPSSHLAHAHGHALPQGQGHPHGLPLASPQHGVSVVPPQTGPGQTLRAEPSPGLARSSLHEASRAVPGGNREVPGPQPSPALSQTAPLRSLLHDPVPTSTHSPQAPTPSGSYPSVAPSPSPAFSSAARPPISAAMASHRRDSYATSSPKPAVPAPAPPAKKTSNLMSLLNGLPSPPKAAPVAAAASSARPQSHSPAPSTVASRSSMAPPSGVTASIHARREADPVGYYSSQPPTPGGAMSGLKASGTTYSPVTASHQPTTDPGPGAPSDRDYYASRPYVVSGGSSAHMAPPAQSSQQHPGQIYHGHAGHGHSHSVSHSHMGHGHSHSQSYSAAPYQSHYSNAPPSTSHGYGHPSASSGPAPPVSVAYGSQSGYQPMYGGNQPPSAHGSPPPQYAMHIRGRDSMGGQSVPPRDPRDPRDLRDLRDRDPRESWASKTPAGQAPPSHSYGASQPPSIPTGPSASRPAPRWGGSGPTSTAWNDVPSDPSLVPPNAPSGPGSAASAYRDDRYMSRYSTPVPAPSAAYGAHPSVYPPGPGHDMREREAVPPSRAYPQGGMYERGPGYDRGYDPRDPREMMSQQAAIQQQQQQQQQQRMYDQRRGYPAP